MERRETCLSLLLSVKMASEVDAWIQIDWIGFRWIGFKKVPLNVYPTILAHTESSVLIACTVL